MTDYKQHPIIPPPELVDVWVEQSPCNDYENYIATKAAQWGADQELDACCEWLDEESLNLDGSDLRADRRPKPPNLKEQALKTLASAPGPDYPSVRTVLNADEHALIRRALEALPDD